MNDNPFSIIFTPRILIETLLGALAAPTEGETYREAIAELEKNVDKIEVKRLFAEHFPEEDIFIQQIDTMLRKLIFLYETPKSVVSLQKTIDKIGNEVTNLMMYILVARMTFNWELDQNEAVLFRLQTLRFATK